MEISIAKPQMNISSRAHFFNVGYLQYIRKQLRAFVFGTERILLQFLDALFKQSKTFPVFP